MELVSKVTDILSRVKYKKGWRIRALRDFQHNNLEIGIMSAPTEDAYGNYSGLQPFVFKRVFPIEQLHRMEDKELEHLILAMVYQDLKCMEMHELDEWFEVDGVKIYNPHAGENK